MRNIVNTILPSETVAALCYTLLHSLWQGVILAILVALIKMMTRGSRPVIRYNLLLGSLVVFALVVAGTFIWELRSAQPGVAGVLPVNHLREGTGPHKRKYDTSE